MEFTLSFLRKVVHMSFNSKVLQLSGSLMSMATGCVGGWSSAAVPLLLNGQATDLGGIGLISVEEASWVTSIINLGSLVGAIPAGHLSFTWGRRNFLLSLAFILIFGWLLILLNCNNVSFDNKPNLLQVVLALEKLTIFKFYF